MSVDAPNTQDELPKAERGIYAASRLWVPRDSDILYISDLLDPMYFDYTTQSYKVNHGDGEKITNIFLHQEREVIIFKEHSITTLTLS